MNFDDHGDSPFTLYSNQIFHSQQTPENHILIEFLEASDKDHCNLIRQNC